MLSVTVLPLFALLTSADLPPAEVIAVFPIHDKSKAFKTSEVDQLSELLANEIVRRSAFKVIPRGEIEALLRTEKNKSFEACYDEACQIELGRELAASKVLKTQLLKLGAQCVLTATLYDLKSATADWAHSEKAECGPTKLLIAVENVAQALGKRHSRDERAESSFTSEAAAEDAPATERPANAGTALSFRAGVDLRPIVYFGAVSGSLTTTSWLGLHFAAGLKLLDVVTIELEIAPLIPLASPDFEFVVLPGVRLDLGSVYVHTAFALTVIDGTSGIELSGGMRLADVFYAGPVLDIFFEGEAYLGLEMGVEFDVAL